MNLGFDNLRPGFVRSVLKEHFEASRIHSIPFDQLFVANKVNLSHWAPLFKSDMDQVKAENKRRKDAEVKITHLRPIWKAPSKFRIRPFFKKVRDLYRINYLDHSRLELEIRYSKQQKQELKKYYNIDSGN